MKLKPGIYFLSALYMLLAASACAQDEKAQPVSPNASPEAKALLQLIYNLSGKYTLTGQHNYPAAKDRNSQFFAGYTGKTPVIWSDDFGFAKAGDKDSYQLRGKLVEEAKRQYAKGALVTLCWHAVPPTANEPVTFQPLPGASPDKLESVQGRLSDQQFKDILTPGTALNKQWLAQVDTIAYYLKQLQNAHVPVLWRPYHEMNGSWFWWGGRFGDYPTKAIYQQIFDRLVNYHKLNNLIWVWSVDRPTRPGMEFNNFYPGAKYLDIVALDVYGSDFNQSYYDQLLSLANGKPVTLAEVGNPPSPQILAQQPKWSYWVIWAGMAHLTSKKQFEAMDNSQRVLGLYDEAFINAVNPFRAKLNLPLLTLNKPADFTGEWLFNEDKSVLDNSGTGNLPYKLKVAQDENIINIKKMFMEEWEDDRITEEQLGLNGDVSKSEFFGSPRTTSANLAAGHDTLNIKSNVTFNHNGQTTQMNTSEAWSLQNNGKVLSIIQISVSPAGEKKLTLVFDRQ